MSAAKLFVVALGLACAASQGRADSQMITANSLSGQFYARERRPLFPAEAPKPWQTKAMGSPVFVLTARRDPSDTNIANLTLQPAVLVISCERIKAKLLAELGLADDWRSRIELLIDRDMTDTPRLTAVRSPGAWAYQLQLPKSIAPPSLLRAVVSALLLEIANRSAGSQSADPPLWLIEGMSAHLQANNLPTLFLQPGTERPGYVMTIEGQAGVHAWLHRRSPLTFQQLSWPEAVATDEDKALFRACSQLFVEELLGFEDGRAALRRMTLQLGQGLNWQTAFLTAFHAHFAHLIDVEKWWGVTCVDFQESEIGQAKSPAEAWRRLQQTLDVPAAVRFAPSQLPSEARITLQDALLTWDNATAKAIALRAESQLQIDLYHSPVEMRPLVESYLNVLRSYATDLESLQRKGDTVKNLAAQIEVLKRSTARQLDALDLQREDLRGKELLLQSPSAHAAVARTK